MKYCTHCKTMVSDFDAEDHDCSVGLLGVDREDSTLISAGIAAVTDSAILGGLLGGSLLGGVLGDALDGDLMD